MHSPAIVNKAVSWPIRALKRFSADRCAPMAASIAFYSAFSLAPTLVMVIAIAGAVFGAEAARGELFGYIAGLLGSDAAASIQEIVKNAHHDSNGGIAALISLGLLIVGASATFSSLNTALSIIWPANDRAHLGVGALVRVRLISFGLVMGVAFLLIISLVLDTAVQAAEKWLFGDSPFIIIGDAVQFFISLVILSGALAALIKYLPDGHVDWRDALMGGCVSAILFSIGKKLFALYLTHAGTANAFGAAGSLAVLLMWLYFAAVVLLLGAEIAAARMDAKRELGSLLGVGQALGLSARHAGPATSPKPLSAAQNEFSAPETLAPAGLAALSPAAKPPRGVYALNASKSDARADAPALSLPEVASPNPIRADAIAAAKPRAQGAAGKSPSGSARRPKSLFEKLEAAEQRAAQIRRASQTVPGRVALAAAGAGVFALLELLSRRTAKEKKTER